MRSYFGSQHNIASSVIGRISFSPVSKVEKHSAIRVNPKLTDRELRGYAGVIMSHGAADRDYVHKSNLPIVYGAKGSDELCDGDIVELLPSGAVNVLYEKNSNDNVIFVTSKCNCNCIMCPQPPEYGEEGSLEMNLKLISLIDKSTEEIALTGGEPTVVGDDLFRLILACKHFLPTTSVLLLTNGIKFSEYRYTQFFSSIGHPALTVAVSLYSDNPAGHDFVVGREGAFNQTLRGLINLALFDNPIEIRIVVHKYTCDRLAKFSEFIYRNLTFVKHVAYMGLETIGRGRDNLQSLWVEPSEIVWPLERAIHHSIQRDMSVSIYNMPLCLLPEKLWPYARQSISGWKKCFAPKCVNCILMETCSGLFSSGIEIFEKYLTPIEKLTPEQVSYFVKLYPGSSSR